MSAIIEQDEESSMRAIVSELSSIRTEQEQQGASQRRTEKEVTDLNVFVRGNGSGKPGIAERLTIVETQLSTSTKTVAAFAGIVVAIVGALIAAFGLLKR